MPGLWFGVRPLPANHGRPIHPHDFSEPLLTQPNSLAALRQPVTPVRHWSASRRRASRDDQPIHAAHGPRRNEDATVLRTRRNGTNARLAVDWTHGPRRVLAACEQRRKLAGPADQSPPVSVPPTDDDTQEADMTAVVRESPAELEEAS